MEDYRRTPLDVGVLSTNEWLQIFNCFYQAGFRGISLTGGEPTLNPDWMFMLKHCKEVGYLSTELTSNLLCLDKYKEELCSANYITKLKVSLDTFDKKNFHYLTRADALDIVLANINYCIDKGFNVQLNRVTMKSTQKELLEYIVHANKLNVSVNLLDLVYYKGSQSDGALENWKNEFVSAEDTWNYLNNNLKDFGLLKQDFRYGYRTSYNNMDIILKDSRLTKRASKCQNCPLYCQEGIFTVRIASDGTITTCPDYKGELPYINGLEALKDNSLTERLVEIFRDFEIKEENHFSEYLRKL